ncbi:hypothetical protein [Aneurinibacillus aneurinilyticus]|uniref:hypothetical protein n=1 Tax=Aneurinibacillus aneurinilyticus TaxID=1391 RepID=UPI002E236D8E|nr:hypothetical protein [Aneurinibacillus aneurinilyticus]
MDLLPNNPAKKKFGCKSFHFCLCAKGRETNRRPFGARCGDDPLWIILDNQHPW